MTSGTSFTPLAFAAAITRGATLPLMLTNETKANTCGETMEMWRAFVSKLRMLSSLLREYQSASLGGGVRPAQAVASVAIANRRIKLAADANRGDFADAEPNLSMNLGMRRESPASWA